jgi:short subunit dehydrogenase-like uncharacterized protein
VAGRCRSKLELLVASLDLSQVPPPAVAVCDVFDTARLQQCVGLAWLCISAVGPFRLYGVPVLEACVKQGTNYIDICGETDFIELIYHQMDKIAIQNEISLITACGYDS